MCDSYRGIHERLLSRERCAVEIQDIIVGIHNWVDANQMQRSYCMDEDPLYLNVHLG